ncbi:MAG TPA: hydroxymethylbilane synthase [Thermoanaerobaculia bacterium]|nr:hydroxymethylbilane synthase [Thermoanaerobaculia bacterium]
MAVESLRIGTRGSKLALWQAHAAARLLEAASIASTIHVIRTTGDRRADVPLAEIGGKGVFIKELEESLQRGEIDVAVHSLKDIPTLTSSAFTLAAFLPRADPRDAWIQLGGILPGALRSGSTVGTSAPRRRAQLKNLHAHLALEEIRGNVDSRLAKLQEGRYDAMVLAAAGLDRLGRADAVTYKFSVDEMIPAAGQGTVALETLTERVELRRTVAAISDPRAALESQCERGVLEQFGTSLDCYSAVAVHATLTDEEIVIRAFLSDLEGNDAIRVIRNAEPEFASTLVVTVAGELIAEGALELLARGTTA